jgi:hypothetical protein
MNSDLRFSILGRLKSCYVAGNFHPGFHVCQNQLLVPGNRRLKRNQTTIGGDDHRVGELLERDSRFIRACDQDGNCKMYSCSSWSHPSTFFVVRGRISPRLTRTPENHPHQNFNTGAFGTTGEVDSLRPSREWSRKPGWKTRFPYFWNQSRSLRNSRFSRI